MPVQHAFGKEAFKSLAFSKRWKAFVTCGGHRPKFMLMSSVWGHIVTGGQSWVLVYSGKTNSMIEDWGAGLCSIITAT